MFAVFASLATRPVARLGRAQAARRSRNHLRAQLDSYQRPAERAEFYAVLSRHSVEQLDELVAATGRRY